MRAIQVILFLLASSTCFATETAIVAVDDAAIRTTPSQNAEIFETKKRGDQIRVSSGNNQGWKKVKTSKGQYGWIWNGDIVLPSLSSDIESRLEERGSTSRRDLLSPPSGYLDFLPTAAFFMHSSNPSEYLFTRALDLEYSYPFKEKLRTSIKLQPYYTQYSPNHFRFPLLVGFSYFLLYENWSLGAGLFAGLEFPSISKPYVVLQPVLANLNIARRLTHRFNLVFKLGFFGSTNLYSTLQGQNLEFIYAGPVLGLGLQFKFYQSTLSK